MIARQRPVLLAGILILLAPTMGFPCASCVMPTGGLGPTHPQSLEVAIAIRQALDLGILEPTDEESYRGLWARLAQREFLPDGFQLLLIEDGSLHAVDRVSSGRDANRSVRVVTGKTVFRALVDRRIDLQTAFSRGLVVIETEPAKSAVAQRTTN